MAIRQSRNIYQSGFTLAELLIALAILGVIATFTIPKIITSQTNGTYNSATKEDAAAMTVAFQSLRNNRSSTYSQGSFVLSDLTPYINYISVDTSSDVDQIVSLTGSVSCGDGSAVCLKMANGTILFWLTAAENFSGTQAAFFVDPDGTAGEVGSTTGPGKTMMFYLSTSGRLETNSTYDTSWFSW